MAVLKSKKLVLVGVLVLLGLVDQFAGTDLLSAAWSSLGPMLVAP